MENSNIVYCLNNPDLLTEEQYEIIYNWMPVQRQNRLKSMKHIGTRKQMALSYLLMVYGILQNYEIDIRKKEMDFGNRGKPFFKNMPDVHFNMSHCDLGVVCAISDSPVGVDIQDFGKGFENIIKMVLSQDEQNKYREAESPDKYFIHAWTVKESVVKCFGEGLYMDVKSIDTCSLDYHIESWRNEKCEISVCSMEEKEWKLEECSIDILNEIK